MQQEISIKLLPSEAENEEKVRQYIAQTTSRKTTDITGYQLLKRSIDARGRQAFINLSLNAFINEPFVEREVKKINFEDVSRSDRKVIVIGAGPAGLFAALKLIEEGIQPIILERG